MAYLGYLSSSFEKFERRHRTDREALCELRLSVHIDFLYVSCGEADSIRATDHKLCVGKLTLAHGPSKEPKTTYSTSELGEDRSDMVARSTPGLLISRSPYRNFSGALQLTAWKSTTRSWVGASPLTMLSNSAGSVPRLSVQPDTYR